MWNLKDYLLPFIEDVFQIASSPVAGLASLSLPRSRMAISDNEVIHGKARSCSLAQSLMII